MILASKKSMSIYTIEFLIVCLKFDGCPLFIQHEFVSQTAIYNGFLMSKNQFESAPSNRDCQRVSIPRIYP